MERVTRQRLGAQSIGLLLATLQVSSCARDSVARGNEARAATGEPSASSAPLAVVPVEAEPVIQRSLPYPRGRWRLASPEELSQVVVWFSHILIRYDGVLDPRVSFGVFDWSSAYPPARRSRDEALALAQRVASEAASGTASFAELVSTYSEDITTVDRGGSPGGLSAIRFGADGQLLDGLELLQPGQTSEVIETGHGFHILQKRAPPAEQLIAGSHIVIGHDDAPGLRYFMFRGDHPHRTREEAKKLATELYERARQNPAGFDQLVERYSEHRDAELRGDLGEWSSHTPRGPAREVETLAQLHVGEVAAPIDTFLGFQILMRTPERARREFAHEALELLYDPLAPEGSADSEAAARQRALEVAARLKADPGSFDPLRTEHCCTETHVWREGRFQKDVQAALSALRIGEISKSPVRTLRSYAFFHRLDPSRVVPPPRPSLELPTHGVQDAETFLQSQLDSDSAQAVLRNLGQSAAAELDLQGERRTQLLALHALPSGIGDGVERVKTVDGIAAATKALLAGNEYERYRALQAGLLEQAILKPAWLAPRQP